MTADEFMAKLDSLFLARRYDEMLEFGSSLIVEMAPLLHLEQRECMHSMAEVAAIIVECERVAAPVGGAKVGGERAARGA